MVVNDLDIVCISIAPLETHAVLVIDPDGVLSCPIASQGFQ
jgi:hypothetical protein